MVSLLLPCGLRAHEIGTTTVRLTLHRDHTWTAFIVTAPQTLANKLEMEAGQPRSSGLTEAALRAELDGFLAALARHVDVRFDGVKSPAPVSISEIQVVSTRCGRFCRVESRRINPAGMPAPLVGITI